MNSFQRIGILSAVGIVAAFVLVRAWAWTAQFSLSSDDWLMAVPTFVVFTGLLASAVLAVRVLRRPE